MSWAEPDAAGEATLTALTVTGLFAGSDAGGVYMPDAEMVPTELLPPVTLLTCHVTEVFVVFITVAVNCVVDPMRTELLPATETETCDGGVPVVVPVLLLQPISAPAKRREALAVTLATKERRVPKIRKKSIGLP